MLFRKTKVVKKAVLIAISLCLIGLLFLNANAAPLDPIDLVSSQTPANELSYVSSPTYDYSYTENISLTNTWYGYFTLSAGQTITLETAKAGTNPDIDTVMYFFKYPIADSTCSWFNNDYTGRYSRISVTVPSAGTYCCLIRGYGAATGYASLYKDGALWNSIMRIGGKWAMTSKTKTGMLNYFTANRNGVDTVMWLVDSSNLVLAMNDDYSGSGSYSWGSTSRVRASLVSNISYAIVCPYYADQTGPIDVYLQCNDGYTSSSSFPNLLADDSIKAENTSTTYNCISWSGGITDTWINPTFTIPGGSLSPWYNANNVTAFDNYYGNNPLRYTGAPTYVNTTNSSESVIDVWISGSSYTHASVRKPGNNIPHGYDWESKLGGNQRIFHPRTALSGGLYGNIVRYYKPATTLAVASLNRIFDLPVIKTDLTGTRVITPTETPLVQYQPDNTMTFEKSVASGLTTTQNITFSSETMAKLTKMKSAAGIRVAERFQGLYQKWVSVVEGSPELMLSSNAYDYMKIHEYRPLEALLRSQGKGAWGLLIDNYLSEKNIFARTLIEVFIVGYDTDTVALAGKIRERNNQISRNSLTSAVYIAPTYETNLMCFIDEIVNPSTGR